VVENLAVWGTVFAPGVVCHALALFLTKLIVMCAGLFSWGSIVLILKKLGLQRLNHNFLNCMQLKDELKTLVKKCFEIVLIEIENIKSKHF
jgi:hypothetical protein